jgi:DNA polymerase III alpha subunit (gram-positive type)
LRTFSCMNSKFIIYTCDGEMTGLDFLKHEIIEISFHRSSDNSQKTWFLKPKNYDSIQSDALRINGHKLEDLKLLTKYGQDTYKDPTKVIVEIENWILEDMSSSEDRIFLGQNPTFDLQFLQKLWADNNSLETFPFGKRPHVLDTKQIQLFLDLTNDERCQYYNLGSLVEKWAVKKEKAHRSDADVRMTKDVFLAQVESIQNLINNQAASD